MNKNGYFQTTQVGLIQKFLQFYFLLVNGFHHVFAIYKKVKTFVNIKKR